MSLDSPGGLEDGRKMDGEWKSMVRSLSGGNEKIVPDCFCGTCSVNRYSPKDKI